MANGEIPGRNDGPYAKRKVAQLVLLTRILDGCSGLRQPECFASIKVEEVDRLRYIRVRFGPVLPNLIREPCAELELAFANDLSGLQQQRGPLLHRDVLPGGKSVFRSFHREFYMFERRHLVHADDLGRSCRVHRLQLVGSAQPLAANDHFVFVAELVLHLFQGRPHGMHIVRIVEVGKRLIAEDALRTYGQDNGAESSSRHGSSSVEQLLYGLLSAISALKCLLSGVIGPLQSSPSRPTSWRYAPVCPS